ncbi:UNVERIFIED_CONTAM: hypothetical protein GTU68_020306 [Idotea baltica]|nr:hypothetical protein [Idotea baltica]
MSRRVLITGSSRGLGKSIAKKLLEDGFSITIHGRTNSTHFKETLSEFQAISSEARGLVFDVVDRKKTKQVLEDSVAADGAFYGIVLSVGIHRDMPFPGMSDEAWDSVIRVDLDGFYNVMRPLVMPMILLKDGGRIVPIASLSGVVGNRGQVNYSAAKAGLIGASKALAQELVSRKITVNCIAPGAIKTDMIDLALEEKLVKQIPMNRLGRAEEIAAAASYLFDEDASFMTGQTLVISGGMF